MTTGEALLQMFRAGFRVCTGAVVALWLGLASPLGVMAQTPPAWLEPKGLGVLDLIGEVPESHLQDAIVSYSAGAGMLQYISGTRQGDNVTVRVKVTPQYLTDGGGRTLVNCLGLHPFDDHWAIAAPESTVLIYSDGVPITNRLKTIVWWPGGLSQPQHGAINVGRHDEETNRQPVFRSDGSAVIPANMGCVLRLDGRHSNLEAEFRVVSPRLIDVEVLGSQVFSFRSYSGAGQADVLKPLQAQLHNYMGDRHDKLAMSIPSGADYVFFNYPPSPVGTHVFGDVDANVRLPSSGTYRLAVGMSTLSVDHMAAMGLPLSGQWRDRDQSGGEYLTKLPRVDVLTAPEYFVPVGVEYDPCMTSGNCPTSLLEQIRNATMEGTVYYYRVSRRVDSLHRVPLRQVGPAWNPSLAGLAAAGDAEIGASAVEASTRAFIPVLQKGDAPIGPLPPDDPNGCPCGWFADDGRMVDYIPGN